MNARFYLRSSQFLLDKYLPDIGTNSCLIKTLKLLNFIFQDIDQQSNTI